MSLCQWLGDVVNVPVSQHLSKWMDSSKHDVTVCGCSGTVYSYNTGIWGSLSWLRVKAIFYFTCFNTSLLSKATEYTFKNTLTSPLEISFFNPSNAAYLLFDRLNAAFFSVNYQAVNIFTIWIAFYSNNNCIIIRFWYLMNTNWRNFTPVLFNTCTLSLISSIYTSLLWLQKKKKHI